MNDQITTFIRKLFVTDELNRLPESCGGGQIFSKPFTGVARGDDPIFLKFKEVVSPDHLTPAELWVQSGFSDGNDLAKKLRILAVIFPYNPHIREIGRENEGRMPTEIYCVARNFANPFMDEILLKVVGFMQDRGFNAVAGVKSRPFKVTRKKEPFSICSNWSERHIAFAAGLGTFSLHEGLITAEGCNIRAASVITDAPLEPTPRAGDEPYAHCLHFAEGSCGECIKKCPAGAISEKGHDKHKCFLYLGKVSEEVKQRSFFPLLKSSIREENGERIETYPVGCALCQFGVPCSDRNPR